MRNQWILNTCAMLAIVSLAHAKPPPLERPLVAPIVDGKKQFPLEYGVYNNINVHYSRFLMMNWHSDVVVGSVHGGNNLHLSICGNPGVGLEANEISHWCWTVRPLDVFPFYNQCYLVTKVSDNKRDESIEFRNVTESIPERLRPASDCRAICLSSDYSPLFYNRFSGEFGEVKLISIDTSAPDSPKATLSMIAPPKTRKHRGRSPGPIKVTVQVGETLASEYQAYRVSKIVPSCRVDIKNPKAGTLVGWVEIEGKPILKDSNNSSMPTSP